jgi:hypothetical protein
VRSSHSQRNTQLIPVASVPNTFLCFALELLYMSVEQQCSMSAHTTHIYKSRPAVFFDAVPVRVRADMGARFHSDTIRSSMQVRAMRASAPPEESSSAAWKLWRSCSPSFERRIGCQTASLIEQQTSLPMIWISHIDSGL